MLFALLKDMNPRISLTFRILENFYMMVMMVTDKVVMNIIYYLIYVCMDIILFLIKSLSTTTIRFYSGGHFKNRRYFGCNDKVRYYPSKIVGDTTRPQL